jgi:hypothetical protein
MKKLLYVLLAIVATVAVVNCGGGGGGGTVVGGGTVIVGTTWYDVYGNACGSLRPGCSYKDSGWTSDKAMWQEDPYYDYWASPEFATVYDTDYGYYVDAWGYWGVNGLFYDYYTGRAVNEGASEMSKDLLTVVGNREEDVIQKAGKSWAAKYNLDATTGVKVARALNDWNKIVKTRERTEADLNNFTKRALGLKLNDLKSASESQNQAQMDSLVEQAAQNWNTSPENMKTILKTIYKDQLL